MMGITTEFADDTKTYSSSDFYIGLGLAISSCVFIGTSFIIKKKALIKLQRYGNLRPGNGGFGYLKDWMWWTGFLCMGIGEAANFAAYAFTPASVVTPLGALSVLISAVLASKYLNERLNLLGKIGCLLCILGSTVIVIHSPKDEEVNDLNELITKVEGSGFIIYALVVIICSMLIIFHFGPKYGKNNIIVYIILCSSIGSLTVMSCKGLGLAIKETISGVDNAFESWLPWLFLFTGILCIMVQMNYLNKSLDLFETSIVTPIYYVFFTSLVIVASAVLFREWENMTVEDILGSSCGFITVIIAIFLLNAFKDMDINFNNVRQMLRPKREILSTYNRRDEERLIPRLGTEIDNNYGTPDLMRTI